jgi:sulfur-oxidizing protein SoxY
LTRHQTFISAPLSRRAVLRRGAMAGIGAGALASGLGTLALAPAAAAETTPTSLAALWPKAAFSAKSQNDALQALFGSTSFETSSKITLNAPAIAANGAAVPIDIDASAIPGVTMLAILVPDNPFALCAAYPLTADDQPSVSTRLKMAKTSQVIAVVQAGGKLYGASQQVKVTLGGCGG